MKQVCSLPRNRNDIETSSAEAFHTQVNQTPHRNYAESLIPSLCSEWMRWPFSASARAFFPRFCDTMCSSFLLSSKKKHPKNKVLVTLHTESCSVPFCTCIFKVQIKRIFWQIYIELLRFFFKPSGNKRKF